MFQPYNPHAADARYDLDMAGYSIVKVLPDNTHRTYRWEPKAAFHTIAAGYGRANPTVTHEAADDASLRRDDAHRR